MSETDKLNAICEVLDNIGLYPSDRRAFEEIRAILDHPAAAPAGKTGREAWTRRCPATAPESDLIRRDRQCQLMDGHRQAHTWHGDGDEFSQWARAAARAEPREDCPSCAGLGDVPCSHHKDRPNSQRTPSSSQAGSSRVLLGWTVPSHISRSIDGGYVHLCCHWTKNVCSTTTSQQNGEWIGQFLRDHAHGQVVERREYDGDADDEQFCGRCLAGTTSPEHHEKCGSDGQVAEHRRTQ